MDIPLPSGWLVFAAILTIFAYNIFLARHLRGNVRKWTGYTILIGALLAFFSTFFPTQPVLFYGSELRELSLPQEEDGETLDPEMGFVDAAEVAAESTAEQFGLDVDNINLTVHDERTVSVERRPGQCVVYSYVSQPEPKVLSSSFDCEDDPEPETEP